MVDQLSHSNFETVNLEPGDPTPSRNAHNMPTSFEISIGPNVYWTQANSMNRRIPVSTKETDMPASFVLTEMRRCTNVDTDPSPHVTAQRRKACLLYSANDAQPRPIIRPKVRLDMDVLIVRHSTKLRNINFALRQRDGRHLSRHYCRTCG